MKEQKTASGKESGKLIEVPGLTKSFDSVEALAGLSGHHRLWFCLICH